MGQVLYRMYRSKSLDEVIGQDHITSTLKHALKNDQIAHAYLFTGPKGIGKTSVARILAHEVNNFPYDGSTYLDIIEIDAASNRRIDEIRNLRDKINLTPTRGKYKVYIIDEVHMLTKEAFNALLKTLEEPPEHVIFILATTEANKLPQTIISRTQRFSFKPVSVEEIAGHLNYIADNEKISVDKDALNLIAQHGDGSFRDSISLLDQLRHQDSKITLHDVQIALGLAPRDAINEIIAAVVKADPLLLLDKLKSLQVSGYEASTLAKQLAQEIRQLVVTNNSPFSTHDSLELLRQLLEVQSAQHPDSLLEVILLDKLFAQPMTANQQSDDVPGLHNQEVATTLQPASKAGKVQEPDQIKDETNTQNKSKLAFNDTTWPLILTTIKEKHNTLYSFVRMARPEFSNKQLTLHFGFKFHQQRVNETKNKESIAQTIELLTGKKILVESVFNPDEPKSISHNETQTKNDPALDAISNIFGGGEVLES